MLCLGAQGDVQGDIVAVRKAVQGIYPNERVESLPDKWRKKYFKRFDAEQSQVTPNILENIIYRKFNLMEPKYTFRKKMQVIFCRNVMIYFDNQTRSQVVEKFYDATEDGGYFFIGHSESLNHTNTRFKYVKPAIYHKA